MDEKLIRENTDYRIVKTFDQFEGKFVVQYGVEVCMNRSGVTESVQILHLFTDVEPILELIDLMQRNTVTPISVRDVIDDFIASH